MVNLARKAKLDAELVMRQATGKFAGRFRKLEDVLRQRGKSFDQLDLKQLDAIWDEVKASE